jgi:hypothetical protein
MTFRNMNNDDWGTSPSAQERGAEPSSVGPLFASRLVWRTELSTSVATASFRTPGEADAWQSRIVARSRILRVIAA